MVAANFETRLAVVDVVYRGALILMVNQLLKVWYNCNKRV